MSERFELSFSVLEAHFFVSHPTSSIKVDVKVTGKSLELNCPSTEPKSLVLSATASLPMALKLAVDGFLVGGAFVSLGDLFPDRLCGTAEAWVQLATSSLTEADLKVRPLHAEVDETEATKLKLQVTVRPISRSPTPNSSYKVRCPYLERITQSLEADMHKLEAVQQGRRLLGCQDSSENAELSTLKCWMKGEVEAIDVTGIDLEHISSWDAEYLRALVVSLAYKFKGLSTELEDMEATRDQIQACSQARADLQDSIEETIEQIRKEIAKLTEHNRALQGDRGQAKAELSEQRMR
jgi:cell division protein ZapA (FtsZ GTPase activity inhibitor)